MQTPKSYWSQKGFLTGQGAKPLFTLLSGLKSEHNNEALLKRANMEYSHVSRRSGERVPGFIWGLESNKSNYRVCGIVEPIQGFLRGIADAYLRHDPALGNEFLPSPLLL